MDAARQPSQATRTYQYQTHPQQQQQRKTPYQHYQHQGPDQTHSRQSLNRLQHRSTFGPDVFASAATVGAGTLRSQGRTSVRNSLGRTNANANVNGGGGGGGVGAVLFDEEAVATQVGEAASSAASSSSSGSRFFNHGATPLNSLSVSNFANFTLSPLHHPQNITTSPANPLSQLLHQQHSHNHHSQKQQYAFRPELPRTRSGLSTVQNQDDPLASSVRGQSPFAAPATDSFGVPRRSATTGTSVWARPKPSLTLQGAASSPRTASPGADIWTVSPLVKELDPPSRSNSASSDSGSWTHHPTAVSFSRPSLRERGPPARSKTLATHKELESQETHPASLHFVSKPNSLLPKSLQAAVAVTLEPEELDQIHASPSAAFEVQYTLKDDDHFARLGNQKLPSHPRRHRMGLPPHLRTPQRATTLDPERHLPRSHGEDGLRSSPSPSGLRKEDERSRFSTLSSTTSPAFSDTAESVSGGMISGDLPQNSLPFGYQGAEQSVAGGGPLRSIQSPSRLSHNEGGNYQQSFGGLGSDHAGGALVGYHLTAQQNTMPLSGNRMYGAVNRGDGFQLQRHPGTSVRGGEPQDYSASAHGSYPIGPNPNAYGNGLVPVQQMQQIGLYNSMTAADAAAILCNQGLIFQALTANPATSAAALPHGAASTNWIDPTTANPQMAQRQASYQIAPQQSYSSPQRRHRTSVSQAQDQISAALGSLHIADNHERQSTGAGSYNASARTRPGAMPAHSAGPSVSPLHITPQQRPPPTSSAKTTAPVASAGNRQQGSAPGAGRSPLLDEFRSRRAMAGLTVGGRGAQGGASSTPTLGEASPPIWGLDEIRGHIVEFCMDQHGSRFAQEQLDRATREQINWVFAEVLPMARTLMQDVFGNYVVQKVFEYGEDAQRLALFEEMRGHVVSLSLGTYGCRVIQKALDYLPNTVRLDFAMELEGNVLELVQDQNANHVVQKLLSVIEDPDDVKFVSDTFRGRVLTLGAHCYSCRVLQRVFERCGEAQARPLLEELCQNALTLVQSPFGNYGVQYVLELNDPMSTEAIIRQFLGKVCILSAQKYSSNVIEKCIRVARPNLRRQLVAELLVDRGQLEKLLQDRFGNYVVQTVLDCAEAEQRVSLVEAIRTVLPMIRNDPYGKRIQTKLQPGSAEQGPLQMHPHQNQVHSHRPTQQSCQDYGSYHEQQQSSSWYKGR